MYKVRLVVLPVLILLLGCKEEPPQVTLDDETLISVLVDLHLAESPMQRVAEYSRDSIGAIVRGRVAQTHGLDVDQMESEIAILQSWPEKSIEIYDSVIVRLERFARDMDDEEVQED